LLLLLLLLVLLLLGSASSICAGPSALFPYPTLQSTDRDSTGLDDLSFPSLPRTLLHFQEWSPA